jgi:hypothetical protein
MMYVSFTQLSSSTMMLVGVFVFNMFMQRKIRKMPERTQPAVVEAARREKTE